MNTIIEENENESYFESEWEDEKILDDQMRARDISETLRGGYYYE